MEWSISDYMYVWRVPAYWHYQLAWRTTHNTLIFSITAQRTSSRNNEIALFMSDSWESRADSFSMNFRATDPTPCIELLCRMQEFGWGWRTLNERRVHRQWRIACRWLAHCFRSPLIISGAKIPLAVHTGNSSLPRPFATVINKNILLVVMGLWRNAKLLANLWRQIELSIRSFTLLAWPQFSLYTYYYSVLSLQFFASLLDSVCIFFLFVLTSFVLIFRSSVLILLPWIIGVCLST